MLHSCLWVQGIRRFTYAYSSCLYLHFKIPFCEISFSYSKAKKLKCDEVFAYDAIMP